MFTGIVEIQGTVLSVNENDGSSSGGNGYSIIIGDSALILKDANIGDSISVNGTCLTVTEMDNARENFKVNIAPETIRKTNLKNLKQGSKVNLERAMSSVTRFGGHMVQGHVNTTVIVHSIELDPPNSLILTFYAPLLDETLEEGAVGKKDYHDDDVMLDILPKGFICLDGVSLTITRVERKERKFSVMLIPHTQKMVTLGKCRVGDLVNVEVDINTKTVRKALEENGVLSRVVEKQNVLEKEIENIKARLNALEEGKK